MCCFAALCHVFNSRLEMNMFSHNGGVGDISSVIPYRLAMCYRNVNLEEKSVYVDIFIIVVSCKAMLEYGVKLTHFTFGTS